MGVHRQHRRVGADLRRRGARARVSAGRDCRPATTTAAIVPATTCSARASSPSICRPASASGTTSSCTTASGTWTSRARRSSPTSPSTAGRSRRSRSRPSRRSSTSSIARPASRSGRSRSGRSRRATCRASGTRRRSRSRPSRRPTIARASSIDDLIDFTPELRAEAVKLVVALQDRTDLHAAGGQQGRRAARHADAGDGRRRHELARRLVRSGDAHRSTCTRKTASASSVSCRRAIRTQNDMRVSSGQRRDRRAHAAGGSGGDAGRGARRPARRRRTVAPA